MTSRSGELDQRAEALPRRPRRHLAHGHPAEPAAHAGALLLGVALCFAVSLARYALMPFTAYYVWLLLGMLLLRFRPLVLLSGDHSSPRPRRCCSTRP